MLPVDLRIAKTKGRHKLKRQLLLLSLTLAIGFPLTIHSQSLQAKSLLQPQDHAALYLQAQKLIQQGQEKTEAYQALHKQLADYPLTIYLDAQTEEPELLKLSGRDFLEKIKKYQDSPLYNRLRHRYLMQAGESERWADFSRVSPLVPKNKELQCLFYRGKIAQSRKSTAWVGAKKLWLHGYSQPKACDPLFKAWTEADQLSDDLIWQRIFLAFQANQLGLIKAIGKRLPKDAQPRLQQVIEIYQTPQSLADFFQFNQKTPAAHNGFYSELVNVGLRRLGSKDIQLALSLFEKYSQTHRFNQAQEEDLNIYLMYQIMLKDEQTLLPYVDARIKKIHDDDLLEMRLRLAMRRLDKAKIEELLPEFSQKAASTDRWAYWRAKYTKDQNKARLLMRQAARQSGFYGFLAASELGTPIKMRNQKLDVNTKLQQRLAMKPAWLRLKELMAQKKYVAARSELGHLFQKSTKTDKQQYTLMAAAEGWAMLAVQATIEEKLWDSWAQRLPIAYTEQFVANAEKYQVDESDLRAITRRESAMNPRAQSPVKARGLMQLMPGTAKETARKHKIPYRSTDDLFDPTTNIALGSAYFGELVKLYKGNRILATAAYNAGPGRIQTWLGRNNGTLSAAEFVESIPFKETREYVQAVLTYRMIYDHLMKKPYKPMLSPEELEFKY